MVLCAQSSLGYPRECLAYYFELLCECPFHKQTDETHLEELYPADTIFSLKIKEIDFKKKITV